MSSSTLLAALGGAAAGAIATAPMTAFMEAAHRSLPAPQRYPLPPSEITAVLEEQANVDDAVSQETHAALTLFNHFAYGAGCGAIYAVTAARLPLPPPVKGVGFGLAVWTVSYLGLLPALGILRPATEHPAQRNALMIAAHVVWGAVAGVVVERIGRRA